jgi:hypothetical protein
MVQFTNKIQRKQATFFVLRKLINFLGVTIKHKTDESLNAGQKKHIPATGVCPTPEASPLFVGLPLDSS